MYRCKARKKYSVDCKSEEVVLYSVTIPTTVRPSAAVMRLTSPFHSTLSTTLMKKIFVNNSLLKGELNSNLILLRATERGILRFACQDEYLRKSRAMLIFDFTVGNMASASLLSRKA